MANNKNLEYKRVELFNCDLVGEFYESKVVVHDSAEGESVTVDYSSIISELTEQYGDGVETFSAMSNKDILKYVAHHFMG